VLAASFLVYCELALLVAVALMFSSFTTPLLAALFSFAIYLIGHFSKDLLEMATLSNSSLTRAILTTLYYLLPNLSNFSYITPAAHGQTPTFANVLLALAYAADGIRVNAIAPGWVRTPLTQALQDDTGRSSAIVARTPLGRWADPQDIAGAAVFLCSPAARFMTGAVVPVDGGYLIA